MGSNYRYPEEFKAKVLKDILENNLTGGAAAEKYKVSKYSVWLWKKSLLANTITLSKQGSEKMALVLPPGKKLEDVLDAISAQKFLNEEEFGRYCRKEGLNSEQVAEWALWYKEHPGLVSRREYDDTLRELGQSRQTVAELDATVRKMQKSAAKKDKALATYAQMLALSKKAAAIFAKEED